MNMRPVTTQVLKQLQQKIDTENKQHATIQQKLMTALKKERDTCANLRRELAERTDSLGKVMKHVENVSNIEMAQRQQRISEMEALLNTLKEAKAMLEERTQERDRARKELEGCKREAEANRKKFEKDLEDLRAAMDTVKRERDSLGRERDGVMTERDAVTAERDAVMAERDALRAEVMGLMEAKGDSEISADQNGIGNSNGKSYNSSFGKHPC